MVHGDVKSSCRSWNGERETDIDRGEFLEWDTMHKLTRSGFTTSTSSAAVSLTSTIVGADACSPNLSWLFNFHIRLLHSAEYFQTIAFDCCVISGRAPICISSSVSITFDFHWLKHFTTNDIQCLSVWFRPHKFWICACCCNLWRFLPWCFERFQKCGFILKGVRARWIGNCQEQLSSKSHCQGVKEHFLRFSLNCPNE